MQLQGLQSSPKKDRVVSVIERTLGAYEARRKFGQLLLLEEAFYKKDRFVVERSGRPMAAIVSIDDYRQWQRMAKERVFTMLEKVWQRTKNVPDEELEIDIEQARKQLQQELLSEKGVLQKTPCFLFSEFYHL